MKSWPGSTKKGPGVMPRWASKKGEKTHTVSTSWELRNSGGPRVAAGEQKLISFTKTWSGIHENWSESMKSLCKSTKNLSGFYEKLASFYEKGTRSDAPAAGPQKG